MTIIAHPAEKINLPGACVDKRLITAPLVKSSNPSLALQESITLRSYYSTEISLDLKPSVAGHSSASRVGVIAGCEGGRSCAARQFWE